MTFPSGNTRDIALVVSEARDDGFRLGSNVSAGFFGFPFNGNLTRDLNPEIAGEVWPMFRFPLDDGATWRYPLFGYDATTTARATLISAPGIGEHPGFRLDATSYGQTFASYDFSPETGWLTRLDVYEPTTGERLLHAELRDYGARFGQGYFLEETIADIQRSYPADAPGIEAVSVPGGYERVHATVVAKAAVGASNVRLEDARGRSLVETTQIGPGGKVAHATLAAEGDGWRLRHVGAAQGSARLLLTGIREVQGGAGASSVDERFDLESMLQSTRPDRPQTGHVTSTALPVAR